MKESSSVGVIDKAVTILDALEVGPLTLADLTTATGIPRPTAHRLAVALEVHGLVSRDADGRFSLGPRLADLAGAGMADRMSVVARPILVDLRDATRESTQLYRRRGDSRICVAGADLEQGLRDTVPVGAVLTMTAGSAAQILTAWEIDPDVPADAAFSARTLAAVRRRGYAHSMAERERGVASLSAPVRGASGRVLAALSLSGPIERLGKDAAERHRKPLLDAAARLSALLAPNP